jgi:hypothetical protein
VVVNGYFISLIVLICLCTKIAAKLRRIRRITVYVGGYMNFNDEFMKLHIPLLTYLSKLSPEEYNSMAEAFDIASLNEFENFFGSKFFTV